jgi:GNAT superfamily N-acetyltransferase
MENLNIRKRTLLPWTLDLGCGSAGRCPAVFRAVDERHRPSRRPAGRCSNERPSVGKARRRGKYSSARGSRRGYPGIALATEKTAPGLGRTAHLSLLAVKPAYQGHGLGRSLLAGITQTLATEGFAGATLGVLEDNLGARRIYEDASWRVTGHGFFEDSGRPCVYYSLELLHRMPRQQAASAEVQDLETQRCQQVVSVTAMTAPSLGDGS